MDAITRLDANIDAALGGREARKRHIRRIVRRFDVDFDLPLRHNRCLGLLTLLDATERPVRDAERDGSPQAEHDRIDLLAGYLGAATCRIVQANLAYEWLEGLRVIEESRGEAAELKQSLNDRSKEEISTGIPQYAAYALARWFDASAKINYRLRRRPRVGRRRPVFTRAGQSPQTWRRGDGGCPRG